MAQSGSPTLFLSWCSSTSSIQPIFLWYSPLLDRLRSGYFSAVHLVPPAATWSRVRHSSVPGQTPLRTRQEPLGASRLVPSQQHKVVQSNSEVEASCWFLEQALRCVARQVQVLLVFPEDLGGLTSDGPATMWDSFEVRSLSGLSDTQRGSAFMCELTGADQRRPLGIFTTIKPLKARIYPGWPLLHRAQLQGPFDTLLPMPSCSSTTSRPQRARGVPLLLFPCVWQAVLVLHGGLPFAVYGTLGPQG